MFHTTRNSRRHGPPGGCSIASKQKQTLHRQLDRSIVLEWDWFRPQQHEQSSRRWHVWLSHLGSASLCRRDATAFESHVQIEQHYATSLIRSRESTKHRRTGAFDSSTLRYISRIWWHHPFRWSLARCSRLRYAAVAPHGWPPVWLPSYDDRRRVKFWPSHQGRRFPLLEIQPGSRERPATEFGLERIIPSEQCGRLYK